MADSETLLSIIQLQHLYITALTSIKKKEYFNASEQLEQAYTIFDQVIDNIEPTHYVRDYAITMRDLITNNINQINHYIYAKEEIVVDTTDIMIEESKEEDIMYEYQPPTFKGPSQFDKYYNQCYSLFYDLFPCIQKKVKIE